MLSFQEIGAAAMLSRAVGGLMDRTVVLSMPGSPAAVRLAVERIIAPELRHLVREATSLALARRSSQLLAAAENWPGAGRGVWLSYAPQNRQIFNPRA